MLANGCVSLGRGRGRSFTAPSSVMWFKPPLNSTPCPTIQDLKDVWNKPHIGIVWYSGSYTVCGFWKRLTSGSRGPWKDAKTFGFREDSGRDLVCSGLLNKRFAVNPKSLKLRASILCFSEAAHTQSAPLLLEPPLPARPLRHGADKGLGRWRV